MHPFKNNKPSIARLMVVHATRPGLSRFAYLALALFTAFAAALALVIQ